MDVALVIGLMVLAGIIGLVDTYAVQRDYADLYAARHGHIPPLAEWFFTKDPDPEVDRLRRLHRNLWVLVSVMVVVAVIVLFVRAPAWSQPTVVEPSSWLAPLLRAAGAFA